MADKDSGDVQTLKVSRDFRHAHPELVRRFQELSDAFSRQCKGKTLLVTCTYRSPEEQHRLFKQGRFGNKGPIITHCDGKEKKSLHNNYPALALDVCVIVGGKPSWDEVDYYPLGPLCTKHGLQWGGYWKTFQDFPHIEMAEDFFTA